MSKQLILVSVSQLQMSNNNLQRLEHLIELNYEGTSRRELILVGEGCSEDLTWQDQGGCRSWVG